MDKRCFLTAHKRARAVTETDIETETGSENIFANQTVFAGLFYGNFQAFDGQRIFGTNVNQPFGGADAVTADSHGFENAVRVAFKDGTVHKRARVAFISIAHHVFLVGIVLAGNFPFNSRGKSGAAASAQSRFFDDIDGFLRREFRQRHSQRLVSIAGDGFVDILGVDGSAISQRDTELFLVKSHVLRVYDVLFGFGIQVQQPVNAAPFNDVFVNNFADIFGLYLRIKSVIGKYFHDRPFLAESETSGFDDLNIVSQPFSV